MLNAAQYAQLEDMVQQLCADVQIEDARLDARQTLEVTLCRAFVCFPPVRIAPPHVDVVAALNGQPEARQALQAHLQSALRGLLSDAPTLPTTPCRRTDA